MKLEECLGRASVVDAVQPGIRLGVVRSIAYGFSEARHIRSGSPRTRSRLGEGATVSR